MTAFGIGVHTQRRDSGTIQRRQEAVACDCWFSSTGRTIPRLVKYQDEEGEIHSVCNIQVIMEEEKHYCGIPTKEYLCRTVVREKEYRFKLIFYKAECRWSIVWL